MNRLGRRPRLPASGWMPAGWMLAGGAALAAAGWLAVVAVVRADDGEALAAPTMASALGWSFDPTVQIPLLVAAALYLWAVRRVDRAHPANRVPRVRIAAFLAGLATLEIALQSSIATYDDVLFTVHMVQHILLTLVAAPLLVLGAPITLLLRVTRPDRRRRWILPVLHSRALRAGSHPVVGWVLFAGVMWGTHFSPIFELSLENHAIHDLEHVVYLAAAVLFWWPVAGLDPGPWRMPHPLRLLYVFLQMPQNTFLGLAIFSAGSPLYPHYASLRLPWLPGALADQQVAGGLMWVSGDLLFLVAVLGVVGAWMRHEERETQRAEARADAAAARRNASTMGSAYEHGVRPAQAAGGSGSGVAR